MAVNIFELARQFGGVLEEPKDQTIDPAELAKQFGGEVVQPVEEPAVRPAPSTTPPPVTGFRGFGEGAAETFRNIIPTISERFKQTGFGVTSRAVDRLPDSINTPPPGVPIEDIERAGGVREYYAQVYGIRSDEELRKVKEESQRRTAARVEASQQRVAELTPQDLNILQRGIRGGVESLGVMAPTVLASVATRSPVPALAGAGALEGFGGYAEARAEGLNPNAALAYGGINALIEVATEAVSAKPLMDALGAKSVSGLKDTLLSFAKREVPAEQLATALQSLNGLAFGLDQELANAKTPEEFARIQGERQLVTAVATVVAGGTQAGGIGAINKVREEMVRRDIESQVRDIEEVGSEIERQRIDEIRNQALEDAQSIAAPELSEIALDEGQTEATPEQYGDNYAQKVYDSVGQYIPANAEFKVEEKVVDGAPRFVVTDTSGTQYGQTLQDKAQADAFALSLNNTTKSRAELLKQLEPLEASLKDTIKGFGLGDVGLTLNDRIFTRRGEALTSEGLFDPVVRRVFLAVDAIDPQGNLDTNQRRDALRGVLRHEVVHALRYLDLWKRSEWKNLEQTVGKVIKPGTDKTYLEIAKEAYGDQSPVIQVEEGVADLIRDVAGNLSRVAGKPRSLSERAINFFDKAKNALTGAGFQTYEDIVQRFEQGDIGARQRGRIRTFRATEEQQAARGEVPERLQRLFTNPQERNQFRQEVAQRVEAQVPAVTAPARNSLRLNAVRESRSTIDPVPPKITVGEREVPTRDSEGRLIYSGYEGPEVFGIQTRPTQEGISNFWNWFKDSKAVDKDKRPVVYYHGTAADITQFRPKQAGSVFVTKNPTFAEQFSFFSDNYMVSNFPDFMNSQQVLDVLNETLASPNAFSPKVFDQVDEIRKEAVSDIQSGRSIRPSALKTIKDIASKGLSSRYLNAIQKRLPSSANMMPVYVSAQNPFDYQNKDDVKKVIRLIQDTYKMDLDSGQIEGLKSGDWGTIESPMVLGAIKDLGFDSMYVEEQGEKNLAVFDPNQIKSAVGNNGDFSPITPSIRESRGVNIEVAPDPRDQAAVDTFNAFPENVRAEITTEVAEPVIRDTMRNLGIEDYEVEYTLGGFQGGTQPSIIIRFGNAVPYNKMLEASKVLGTLWKQQAVIVYDENDKQGGVQTQFVKVIPSRKLSYDETKDLFKQIYDRYPDAAGFTGREGSLVFGNFSGNISPKDFHQGLDKALEDIDNDYSVTTTSDAFRSDWIEPVNLQGTQYESDTQRPVERGEVLRRQREFDSLQGRSDELFRAAVQKRARAEAAPAEAALTPAARESRIPRSSVSIFEMPDEEAKRILGLEPGKNITRFVGERLNQRTLDEFGKIEDTDTSDKAAKQIADAMVTEVLYQLQSTAQTGTGIGWYSNNYPRALERLANRFPELKTDPNARALFTAIVAITSNGEDVNQNISNAVTIYSEARRGRRLSELSVGTRRSDALQNNLEVLDDLVDRYGLEGFSKVLLEEMTVKDINAELRRLGQESNSAYTADTVMPRAALYFGPKLGAFYANLMGSEGYLTMDLWWSRMFNRLRGTLIPKPTQSSIDTIRKMLVDIGMLPPSWAQNIIVPTDDEVIEAAVPFWESAKNKKYKNTTALEKAANTLIKSARLELEEAPFRASDRSFMIRTTRLAQDQLRRRGINLSLADIQAALWYYEKRLYGKLTGRATDDIGYEEALLRAAEGARPERSPPRFFGGRSRGIVTEATGETVGRVVPAEVQAITPPAREARRRGTPIGPPQPGPVNNTDNTSAAEALNNGQPVDTIGVPIGPTISSTEPDGTVSISDAQIAPLTKRLVVQMIQSAPDRLRAGVGLDDIAKRVENYYDTYSSRLGVVNDIIRDAFNRIGFRDRNAATLIFEQFMRARENGRMDEAQAILDQATDSERQLIDAWNEISLRTGEINTSLRTPEGKPMRVWDAKRGEWRPIRSVRNFFPRAFRREVMEVMRNPDLDPQLWRDLLGSLVAAGRADTTQDAENYLLREWFSDEIKQDYFSGVEKARNEPLPEIFYDYSWDAATRYMRKWARRTSQIENFGQTLGTFQKEWFDANIPKVRDPDTQNYLNSIKERIYEIEQFSALTNMANWANSLATATQLGNPISASLNLLGGTVTNVQEFGIKEIAKAYIELAKDWKNVQKEGTTLGILNKDFMNILNDHVEMDADKYFSKEQKVSQALAKFTNVMLTVGGFNGAENIVRSAAMLAARSRLNSFLNDVNDGQETKQVQAFREWVKRENLDIDALILEDGAGKETERFLRRAVNVPQGSYNIDMTPVFIDTAAGRFLLKYQKFGTQINRFFYNHFLKPFYDKPDPKNFMRIAGFLGTAVIGGGAIIAIREAFGYGDPGPDDEEIVKAFENEDTARAWGLIFSRAWQNIMTAGSLGFFANYAQFAKDWQDQQRVKNPFSPPGLASIDAVIDIFNRLRDQGKLTARDLDEIAEGTMSFYRANKRIALAGMDAIGVDAREVRRFAAQRDIREVREYGRRYSEAMDIEFKQRTAPGRVVRTPMTPANKAITDALQQGDSARARLLIRDAKEGLTFKEKQRVMSSIRAAVRNRQPIQIGGNAPSQQERAEFMRWSRQNLPAEKYEMIRRLDRQYKRAATRAGVGFGD